MRSVEQYVGDCVESGMKTSATAAVLIVTAVLVVYTLLGSLDASITLMAFFFLASPVLVVWMVWRVLVDDGRKIPELGEGEEWGYADRPRDSFK